MFEARSAANRSEAILQLVKRQMEGSIQPTGSKRKSKKIKRNIKENIRTKGDYKGKKVKAEISLEKLKATPKSHQIE